MTTSKGQATTTKTEAQKPAQRFAWAVEIGYSTPLRLNNSGGRITISSNVYTHWDFGVSDVSTGEDLVESISVSFMNSQLSYPYAQQRLSELDFSDDAVGKTITIYRVQTTAGGVQSEEVYFSGDVDGTKVSEEKWVVSCVTAQSLTSLRGSNIDIGICRFRTYGNVDCGITPTFSGTGLNDMAVYSYGTPSQPSTYVITIDSAGGTDTFAWTVNGGGGAAGVSCSTSPITLGSEGFQIVFGAATGHTAGGSPDTWTIDASCTFLHEDCDGSLAESSKSNQLRFGGLTKSPLPGEKILIPGMEGYIQPGGTNRSTAPTTPEVHYPTLNPPEIIPVVNTAENIDKVPGQGLAGRPGRRINANPTVDQNGVPLL